MRPLVEEPFSTEKSKVMNLTSFSPTSNLVSFLLREVLPLDLISMKKRSLKLGFISVEAKESSE